MKMEKGQYTMPNGKTAVFNHLELRSAITRKAKAQGISRQELMENITDEIGISFSSLKHWIQGHNAPSDLEKVQDIAKILGLTLEDLLTEKGEENMTMNTCASNYSATNVFASDRDAIRSIYLMMVDFIESFRVLNSQGADKMQKLTNIYVCLTKARFEIPTDIFTQLHSFTVNYLQQMVLADKLFPTFFDEDSSNGIDPGKLYDEFVEYGNLISFCYEPWFDFCGIDLALRYRSDVHSEDAQLATKAIDADWRAAEEGDPFIPFFYCENLIHYAYERLSTILSKYMTV